METEQTNKKGKNAIRELSGVEVRDEHSDEIAY